MNTCPEPTSEFVALVDAIVAAGHTRQSVLRRLNQRIAGTPPGPERDNLIAFRDSFKAALKDSAP